MKYPRPGQNKFVLHEKWQLFRWWVILSTQSISEITSTFPRDSPHAIFPFPKSQQASSLVDALAIIPCLALLQCIWPAAYNRTTTHRAQIAQIDQTTSEDQKSFVFKHFWVTLNCLPSFKFGIVSWLKSWSISGVLQLYFWHSRTLLRTLVHDKNMAGLVECL